MTKLPYQFNKLTRSLLLLLLFPVQSFATIFYYPYAGGSFAVSNGHVGNGTPTIGYDGDSITDVYRVNRRYSTRPEFSLNGGVELMGKECNPSFDIGLGLYATPTFYAYNGNVVETADGGPSTTLYNFNYKVSTMRLMLEGQFNLVLAGGFSPFVNAGIGTAWVSANNYKETANRSLVYPPFSHFASKTTNNFAYQAGLGVSYSFSTIANDSNEFKPERVSLGVRYVNLGSASFGTRGKPYPYALNIGNISAGDIYLSYAHYF
jgi:opacity protein-like surface antigen